MLGNESNKESFWAKVIGAAKIGVKVVVEEVKYFINLMHWGHSGRRIRHEATQAFNKALDKPTEEYNRPIKTTQASENLGIRITGYKKGIVVFEASRTLTGYIPHLNDEQLGKIETLNKESKYSNITIYGEENKVVIEIDVEKIINDIKADPKNKGISEEQIKKLALQRIAEEVDGTLKGLARIARGELARHTDLKLLNGIAEKLYKEHEDQKSLETIKPKDQEKPLEIVTRLEKPVQSLDETLRSSAQGASKTLIPKTDNEPSEAFRRIVQEAAEPLIDSGESKVESSASNPPVEVAKDPPVDSGEAARKAVEKANEPKSAQKVGISSENLKKLSLFTGGCGTQVAKLQERQGQGSEKKNNLIGF